MVITALTRNQVYQQWYRGFESHPLRQKPEERIFAFFRFFGMVFMWVGFEKGDGDSRHKQSGGLFVSPRENPTRSAKAKILPFQRRDFCAVFQPSVFIRQAKNCLHASDFYIESPRKI